jgi:Family of unknown function (DUF6444)
VDDGGEFRFKDTMNRDALVEPSRQELIALIAAQASEIAALRARSAELERRLGLNSSNSGKPPSSDGLKKPPGSRQRSSPNRRLPSNCIIASGFLGGTIATARHRPPPVNAIADVERRHLLIVEIQSWTRAVRLLESSQARARRARASYQVR